MSESDRRIPITSDDIRLLEPMECLEFPFRLTVYVGFDRSPIVGSDVSCVTRIPRVIRQVPCSIRRNSVGSQARIDSPGQLKMTEPMSRCILSINHKYIVKYIPIKYVGETTGSGIIIKKLMEHDTNTIFILTAFHIAVPNIDLSFWTFSGISFMTAIILLMGSLFQYPAIILPRLFKFLSCLTLYMLITTSMMYYILWFIYPTIFESLFKFELIPKGQNEFSFGSDFVTCQLVSSRFILSYEWFDDIAITKCNNVETNILNYVKVCVATLNSTQAVLSGSSISTIGFVGRPPESFDLLINPFFSAPSPLISIPSVHGKKPAQVERYGPFTVASFTDRMLLVKWPLNMRFFTANGSYSVRLLDTETLIRLP